jgi:hypothetical protein
LSVSTAWHWSAPCVESGESPLSVHSVIVSFIDSRESISGFWFDLLFKVTEVKVRNKLRSWCILLLFSIWSGKF